MLESAILTQKYQNQTALAEECGGSVERYMEQAHIAAQELAANEGIQLKYANPQHLDQPKPPIQKSS